MYIDDNNIDKISQSKKRLKPVSITRSPGLASTGLNPEKPYPRYEIRKSEVERFLQLIKTNLGYAYLKKETLKLFSRLFNIDSGYLEKVFCYLVRKNNLIGVLA